MSESERLSEAVGAGSRRRVLEAQARSLAAHIEVAETKDQASLHRQLVLVFKELDALPAAKGRSTFDDLAARRASRKPKAAGQ